MHYKLLVKSSSKSKDLFKEIWYNTSYNGRAKINSPILPTVLIHMPWYKHHQSVSESIGEERLLMAGLCGYDIPVTFDPLIVADCQLLKIHWLLQWVGRAEWYGGGRVMEAASQHMESLNGVERCLGGPLFWLLILWRTASDKRTFSLF